ncbi:MAG TPA: WecB/TagA/CpsF family glycosyltransferase [Bacillales bacterium]|nr:WecB/TagA/CpsF family glycosyltransferase [Bacillales bacterium]
MKETILGINVISDSYTTLLTAIRQDIQAKRKALIIAINPEKIMKAQHSQAVRDLLNQATYPIPDGVGMIIASRLKRGQVKQRVTGIDLFLKICGLAQQEGHKVFLYGSQPGVAKETKARLERMYPGIHIVGTENGYEKDDAKIVEAINGSGADILFVAKGSPLQEMWIRNHMQELNVSIFQGVGGSFDVICGRIKRAPAGFRRLGLEWLYRLLNEPSRFRRQLALPHFLIRIFLWK